MIAVCSIVCELDGRIGENVKEKWTGVDQTLNKSGFLSCEIATGVCLKWSGLVSRKSWNVAYNSSVTRMNTAIVRRHTF